MLLIRRNTRRYGGYIIHFGIVVMFIGIAGGAFNQAREMEMSHGQQLRHRPLPPRQHRHDTGLQARVRHQLLACSNVYRNGKYVTQLAPEKRTYFAGTDHEQASTIVALHSTAQADLYTVFEGTNPDIGPAHHQGISQSADRVDMDWRGDCGGRHIHRAGAESGAHAAAPAPGGSGCRAARRGAGRASVVGEGAPCVSSHNSGALTSPRPIFWARTVQIALLCVVTVVDAGRRTVALRPPRPRADVLLRMRPDPAGVQPCRLPRFGA